MQMWCFRPLQKSTMKDQNWSQNSAPASTWGNDDDIGRSWENLAKKHVTFEANEERTPDFSGDDTGDIGRRESAEGEFSFLPGWSMIDAERYRGQRSQILDQLLQKHGSELS